MPANYYKILCVPETATDDEIKAAYKKLAKQFHPDRHSGNKAYEEKFKEISEAYQALGDPKQRAEYDQMRRFGRGRFRQPSSGAPMDFDLNDLFRQFHFSQGRARRPFSGFSSFFQDVQADGFGEAEEDETNGTIQSEITIPFRKAVTGGAAEFTFTGGDSKTVRVQIPPGTHDGGKIMLRGMGRKINGRNGDLILTVRVEPDPVFTRKGLDVYREIRLNLAQMMLGCSIRVKTAYDEPVDIKIPANTQPGTVLKASGLGIRSKIGTGNFLIKVTPEFPSELNKKQKELFETFARACQMKW